MTIDFSNVNTLWATVMVETLHRLGLTTAMVCPGSRSAPLAIAFARHPQITAIPALDERSASFFALGAARRTGRPVVLVCTSGTAGANFYPAVIEARESRVPLLILTADRPPELRACNAGQAIDQQKLYGNFVNSYAELAVPEVPLLAYLRQTMVHAWQMALSPVAGPVHLNVPFRDPLVPVVDPAIAAIAPTFAAADFFAAVLPLEAQSRGRLSGLTPLLSQLSNTAGLIIAGPAQPQNAEDYVKAIAQLSQTLGYPVLAEGLSPLRNFAQLNPNLIAGYDLILRHPALQETLAPTVVIRIGDLPTSKTLRTWLDKTQPRQYVIAPNGRNLDPLHGKTLHLRTTVNALALALADLAEPPATHFAYPSAYLEAWTWAEQRVQTAIARTMQSTADLIESKVAWTLARVLPPDTPIFISNSMPVRDVECFWTPNSSGIRPYCNRGANGIDGILSTALGMASGDRDQNRQGMLLTGDLALLHDTNGFLLRSHFAGHLTIVLINNNGGGIFEMLPIAAFEPPFEEFFATPQAVDFAQLCATYAVDHEVIPDWQTLRDRLNPLPDRGIRVLEVRCDRRRDAAWRQASFSALANAAQL